MFASILAFLAGLVKVLPDILAMLRGTPTGKAEDKKAERDKAFEEAKTTGRPKW